MKDAIIRFIESTEEILAIAIFFFILACSFGILIIAAGWAEAISNCS